MKEVAVLLASTLLILSGCFSTPPNRVNPSTRPASQPAAASETATDLSNSDAEPTEKETPDEPTEDAVVGFKEKYTYEDRVGVEVTKRRTGTFTGIQTDHSRNEQKGDTYIIFTVRVENGSKAKLDLDVWPLVTYGPDGVTAEPSYLLDDQGDMSGKLLPRKARTANWVYLVPKWYYGDVILQLAPTSDREAAIFAGPLN